MGHREKPRYHRPLLIVEVISGDMRVNFRDNPLAKQGLFYVDNGGLHSSMKVNSTVSL